jgi:D-sedoheptulose 7-phosphate isomerase
MSHDSTPEIRAHLEASAAVTLRAAAECAAVIAQAADLIAAALSAGGKLLLCGNGGSAANCQHLAAEFVNVLDRRRPRPALPAITLTTDTSLLTAIANDRGFDQVFERQVEALGRRGDVLLAITTGGSSPNVIRALGQARRQGLVTIVLTGAGSGEAAQLADVVIRVPSENTQNIQETHLAVGHILCGMLEQLRPPS